MVATISSAYCEIVNNLKKDNLWTSSQKLLLKQQKKENVFILFFVTFFIETAINTNKRKSLQAQEVLENRFSKMASF